MKVLYLTDNAPDSPLRQMASMPYFKISNLPCEVVECRDAECLREHAGSSDVILFNYVKRAISFIDEDEIALINELDHVLIGMFPNDPWRQLFWHGDLRCDLIISPRYESAKQYGKVDMSKLFWSPCCCDVQDYGVPRDIDILWWSSPKGYPFRTFIYTNCFEKYRVGKPTYPDRNLEEYQFVLDGQKYRWVRIPIKNFDRHGHYGDGLYAVIARAKVCPTGPHWWKGPLGKYFENAACGAVTITCDFTDRRELGFKHKENIWITDEAHFVDDLSFLLTHDELRNEMSENAKELIRTQHTPKIRALELYEFLCKKVGEA